MGGGGGGGGGILVAMNSFILQPGKVESSARRRSR